LYEIQNTLSFPNLWLSSLWASGVNSLLPSDQAPSQFPFFPLPHGLRSLTNCSPVDSSRASMMTYAWPSDIPSLLPYPPSNRPVEQPKRNSLFTFRISFFQNSSISSMSDVNSSVVTPPVRSSTPSLIEVSKIQIKWVYFNRTQSNHQTSFHSRHVL
jgi:hypothetical protein